MSNELIPAWATDEADPPLDYCAMLSAQLEAAVVVDLEQRIEAPRGT